MSHICTLARKHGKDNFVDFIFSDNFHKLLWGIKNLTCYNDMTHEEHFEIAISLTMNKPVKTCRILSTCEFFKNLKCSDIDVQLSEAISGKMSWELIISCVLLFFTYVEKDEAEKQKEKEKKKQKENEKQKKEKKTEKKQVTWASDLVVMTDTDTE